MTIGADEVGDQHLDLADGRRLGFRVYGDPGGVPVLFLHGTPGSRIKFSIAHEAGLGRGLAIVAPDRWGYGLTEAPAKPSLAAFGADMTALMDSLGHERFAVGGISGGGPYAAAVGARLGPRVTALALVSPVGPIVDAGLGPSLPPLHRFCFTVLPKLPRTVATAMRAFRWSLERSPRLAGELTTWRAVRPDKRLIRRPEVRQRILGSIKEGLRTGTSGPNIDLSIFSRPWDIDLSKVAAPARLWIGTRDSNVPIAAAHALGRRIPGCELIELQNWGHLWVSVHHADVLTWVASTVNGARPLSPLAGRGLG
jgi:pimeloyl-ACP methyl ester carboxylesterase